MKKSFKIYLTPEDYSKLKSKAESLFGEGRGIINLYIEKIIREQICFLDNNVKILLESLNLKQA